MSKPLTVSFVAGIALIAGIFVAEARPEYAQKESKKCGYCHLNSAGSGNRGFRGIFYGANNLSFGKFVEEREASIAGVEVGVEAGASRPKVGYAGNVTGPRPAANQIQAVALRNPVLVAFFSGSTDDEKQAAKILKKVALAYGPKVVVVGVMKGDFDQALKLSTELGSQIRVFADTDGGALKKFGATTGLDLVVISKRGDEFKLISGYSKGNLSAAIAQIGTFGVEAPQVDLADAPEGVIHGAKIGS
jgi:hypothetical protein